MKKLILIFALTLLGSIGARAQFFGVRGGLSAGAVSVGAEAAVSKQWSVEAAGYWSPMGVWWVQPAVKWWRYEHFVGPFFAAHPAYGRYSVGNKKWRYQGWFSGLGVSYGYSWLLARRWNLTAEGGVGVYYFRDEKRPRWPDDWAPMSVTHRRRIMLAPSKFEVSVNYLF